MTTPHDDELRSELLDVPDHRPEFWTSLDTDLAAEEREDLVPLASAPSVRPRGRGLLLAAAVLVVLGGIGAYFAFGDDDGPDVAVDPEPSVTTAPDPTTPPRTVREPVPTTGVQSLTATVELVSAVATEGTFSLVANEDGTAILRNEDAEFGYHAPSGATWSREGDRAVNWIDPIDGRSILEFRLSLDLADAVRYDGLGTPGERDGRPTIDATVELTDNESAGWDDRTVTATIDAETGFVLDAIATEGDGVVVEELHLTDVAWSDQPADISGAVGVDSDWTVTEGLPAQPLPSGLDLLVPGGGELERVFTTEAPVQTGSEAGNPVSAGAYVVNVTTAPWRHSKVVVLAGSGDEWRDPLATEGWFAEFESVTPATGYLSGVGGTLTASPPQRPRVWFDTGDELIVAIDGLIDAATAERLWNLEPAEGGPEGAAVVPDAVPAPDEGSLIENGPTITNSHMITDGDTLWFADRGDLTRFDLATGEITGAVSMPDVLGSLRVGRSMSFLDGSGTLSDVDLGSLTTIHTVDVPGLRTISWTPVNRDGAIWFGTSDTIQRVLRETGEETHRFEVEPESFGFATDDAFWSVGPTELLRIDFATFEVTRTPLAEELPRRPGSASAEDDGGLWVGQASAEDDGGLWVATLESSTISVRRVDLQSGAVGPSIAVSAWPSEHLGDSIPLVVEKGALWVSGLADGGVARVDLSTFEVIEVPGKGAGWRTANVIGEEIWVEDLDSLLRLDPTTAAIVETLELPPVLQEEDGFGWLPVDEEVWIVDSSLNLRAIPRR